MRVPRRMPWPRNQAASWVERDERSSKLYEASVPSASMMRSAARCGCSAASTPSNQSSAKLKLSGRGHSKSAYAVS